MTSSDPTTTSQADTAQQPPNGAGEDTTRSRAAGADAAGDQTGGPRQGAPMSKVGVAKHGVVGFLMGSADVVPGVSGGTIALVCGIYPRLIGAVSEAARAASSLLRGDARGAVRRVRELDWALLLPLVVGIGLAVVSLAPVLEHMLEEQPVRLAGLFLGLVLGSVVVSVRLLRRPDTTALVIGAVVAIALFLVLGLRQETTAEAADTATAPVWAYPAAAVIAICAMILPGISGSFLLVLMGMYGNVLAAVNDREIGLLLLFVLGCAVGLGLFSRVLGWLMEHHYDRVVAAMIGLMLGSLRVLWPWPGGTSTTELSGPADDVAIPLLLALVGFVVVVAIGRFGLGRPAAEAHGPTAHE
jgi:putative membrane protein